MITTFKMFEKSNFDNSIDLDKYYQNMPKKQVEELVEYWSNLKYNFNKGEIKLDKSEIAKLKEVQKYVDKYYPEFNGKFHSKEGKKFESSNELNKSQEENLQKTKDIKKLVNKISGVDYNKADYYGYKGISKPDIIDIMISILEKLNIKLISKTNRDEFDDIVDDFNYITIKKAKHEYFLKEYDTIIEKLKALVKQVRYEFTDDDFDKKDGTLDHDYDKTVEKLQKFIIKISDEYIKKQTTEILNHKLF